MQEGLYLRGYPGEYQSTRLFAMLSFLPVSGNQSEGSGSFKYGGIEDSESQVSIWIGNLES